MKSEDSSGPYSRKVYINGVGPSGTAGGPADYKEIKPYSAVTGGSQGNKVGSTSKLRYLCSFGRFTSNGYIQVISLKM